MVVLLEGFFRNTSTGAGVNAGTATAKKHSDGSTIATDTTAGTGADAGNYEFSESDIDYPGQVYIEETKGTTTRIRSSKTNGIIGPFRPNDFTRLVRALGDGIVSSIGDGFAVTASGSDLVLTVDDGFALGAGQTYFQSASQTVTVADADATNPRIDRVVIRFYPIDTSDEDDVGRVEVDILKGTAAATPTAPSLTQDLTDVWEIALASVAVAKGATTLSSDDLTDERAFVPFFPASGTDGQYLTLTDGEPAWDSFTSADVSDFDEAVEDQMAAVLAAGSGITVTHNDSSGTITIASSGGGSATITVQEGDTTKSSSASTLDFDGDQFAITESPTGEANISIASGGIGATELASDAVTNAKLADDAADTAQIKDGAVTADKLDSTTVAELIQDQIGAHVVAGDNITVTYNDTTGDTTIAAADAGSATVQVRHQGSTVASRSTLDFRNPFTVTDDTANSDINIGLSYGTTSDTPAEGSHGHSAFQNFEVNASRDSPTSGAKSVSSTSGVAVISDTMTLSNGVTYDIFVWGHAQLNAPSGAWIWAAIDVSGTGISWSPVWLGTGTVDGERGVGPYAVVRNVTGAGQTVTVSLKAKVSSGTGSVSTASFLGQAIARGVGGAT